MRASPIDTLGPFVPSAWLANTAKVRLTTLVIKSGARTRPIAGQSGPDLRSQLWPDSCLGCVATSGERTKHADHSSVLLASGGIRRAWGRVNERPPTSGHQIANRMAIIEPARVESSKSVEFGCSSVVFGSLVARVCRSQVAKIGHTLQLATLQLCPFRRSDR